MELKGSRTEKNLLVAFAGESQARTRYTFFACMHATLYPNFADVAEKEGFKDVAITFRIVAKVERYHERRYAKLWANMKQGKVFKKDSRVRWKCRNCGYVYEGSEAAERCPVCDHSRSYQEVWCENY